MDEAVHASTDRDDDADPGSSQASGGGAVRLPRNRNRSPWTWGLLVISVIVVVLLTPLWLDPWTLEELFGGSHSPTPAASQPAATPDARPSEMAQ